MLRDALLNFCGCERRIVNTRKHRPWHGATSATESDTCDVVAVWGSPGVGIEGVPPRQNGYGSALRWVCSAHRSACMYSWGEGVVFSTHICFVLGLPISRPRLGRSLDVPPKASQVGRPKVSPVSLRRPHEDVTRSTNVPTKARRGRRAVLPL